MGSDGTAPKLSFHYAKFQVNVWLVDYWLVELKINVGKNKG